MLKDDLQACLVSGYSFIGCSKFDQVDGYFGRGATKCNYRGVAEMAFAQGACLFAETLTKGLHKVVWFPNPLAAGSQMGTPSNTRGLYICARGVAQNACTRGLHACTDFHKGLAQARTRADIFAQTCTWGWHTCTDFHKKGLAQARTPLLLLAQSQRLAQGACTIAHPCTRACTKACTRGLYICTSGCNLGRRRRDT